MSQPNRMSRRGVPANLLELPMHLAFTSWAAILMGMSGHDLRTFHMLRKHLAATPAASSLQIESNGMTSIDTAWVVIGAISFVWGGLSFLLGAAQFKGRKGSYTGKGTALWGPVGLMYFIFLILWFALTVAYTYYAVNKSWSLKASGVSEPLSGPAQFLCYQIAQSFRQGYAQPLFVPDSLQQLGIAPVTLGPWGEATTIDQVNDLAGKYKGIQFYRAELICTWFALATVFCTLCVHVALPMLLKTLGWTREEKRLRESEPIYPRFQEKEYYPYPY